MQSRAIPRYRDLPKSADSPYPNAWGVFGDGDQIGTLNHLSPERVLEALKSVRSGQVVNLNLSLSQFDPALISHRGLPSHEVFGLNEFHRDDRIDNLFTQASTQIDGLRHFGNSDMGFYNNFPKENLVAGTTELGIQNVAQRGIVGRGLLLDLEFYRESVGRPIDQQSNEQLGVEDLEGALDLQGNQITPGDILLIRTGWLAHIKKFGRDLSRPVQSPGLAQDESIAQWIWDNQVSVAAADNIALEAWPADKENLKTLGEIEKRLEPTGHTGMLHRILIPLLGLTIGELWDLDELAIHCHRRKSFDFLVTSEPLNMLGGVGSPANALAIL